MDSSSSIAFSKDKSLISVLVFATIVSIHSAPARRSRRSYKVFNASSSVHQSGHMRGRRLRQTLKVVAALENGHNAPMRAGIGDVHDFARDPGKVGFNQVEVRQRVAHMR